MKREYSIFREQCDGIVCFDSIGSNVLPMLSAWRGSSSVYWIKPPHPLVSLTMKIADAEASRYVFSQSAQYHPSRGLWRVYLPGKCFSAHCETAYKIVAVNADEERCVLGEGVLRVYGGKIQDPDDDLTAVDACYVFFPDGCYRKIFVSEDDSGSLTFVVSDETFPVEDFRNAPEQLYAYDKQTGFFHAVVGIIDETGTPSLKVSEESSSAGDFSFVLDERTNLYYRVESSLDETGVSTLLIGEKK